MKGKVRKHRLLPLLLAACMLLLCGCGSLFDREYLSVTDYEPPAQELPDEEEEGTVVVRNQAELRRALRSMLDEWAEEGRIIFDAAYSGDINADIASACWQVRTQDALYAYCVENISYDVSKIVARYEAKITIRYTAGRDRDSIVRLQLTNELEEQLIGAIQRGDGRLVVLIARSSYSAEEVESLASRVYRENPALEPREARVTVNMLSGTGQQRLYEINFQYSLSQEELAQRRDALQAVTPFANPGALPEEPMARALMACRYLVNTCRYSENGQGDIYSALVLGEADSEGLSLAYVELCRQAGVPCQIVYGQRDWNNCCWNIIEIDGDNYHVDVSACMTEGMTQGFMLRDQTMWGRYRWDISSYPPCDGPLHYEETPPEQNTGEETVP